MRLPHLDFILQDWPPENIFKYYVRIFDTESTIHKFDEIATKQINQVLPEVLPVNLAMDNYFDPVFFKIFEKIFIFQNLHEQSS